MEGNPILRLLGCVVINIKAQPPTPKLHITDVYSSNFYEVVENKTGIYVSQRIKWWLLEIHEKFIISSGEYVSQKWKTINSSWECPRDIQNNLHIF